MPLLGAAHGSLHRIAIEMTVEALKQCMWYACMVQRHGLRNTGAMRKNLAARD